MKMISCNLIWNQCDINPFVPCAPFLYPLKTSVNRKIFWCFQGAEKRCNGNNWVNDCFVIELKNEKVVAPFQAGTVCEGSVSKPHTLRSWLKLTPKPSKVYNFNIRGLRHRSFPGNFPNFQNSYFKGNHWTTTSVTATPLGHKSHSQPLPISVHHPSLTQVSALFYDLRPSFYQSLCDTRKS